MQENEQLRLNKFLSNAKYCSRRQADKLISEKRVKVDGRTAITGQKITLNQKVEVDGKKIEADYEYVYLAYNKPEGIICTTDPSVKDNIVEAVGYSERIFPVGRLDRASKGLIILTNDGGIVNKILRAKNNHEKEYIVKVDKPITSDFIEEMRRGVPVLGTVTKQCKVKKTGDKSFRIILTQGLNRQIRRMCEYLGYEVTYLQRIRIMNISLGTLKEGWYRHLTKKEMALINESIDSSDETEYAGESYDE